MYVSDIDAMADFYTEVLGFQVADRGPTMGKPGNPEMVFLSHVPDEEHHQLALIHARTSPGRSNTINHLSFRVEDLPALRDVSAYCNLAAPDWPAGCHFADPSVPAFDL